MKSSRNHLACKLQKIKLAAQGLENREFYAVFLISVILAGIFSLSPTLSLLVNNVDLRVTGKIAAYVAASGSASDIQAAVNEVAASATGIGDVYIPPGTFNFVEVGESWMTVDIPAGVNLFGAPTDRNSNGQVISWETVLVMPFEAPDGSVWFNINGNGDPDKPSQFSDIKLIGYRDFDPSSTTLYRAISLSNVVDFRIDHNFFKHTTAGIWIGGPPNSASNGVIDHNRFINDYGVPAPYSQITVGYGVGIGRVGTTYWDDNIDNVVGHYTNYSVFIEDNYFSKWRHCVSSNEGAHYVFRHNTIEDDFGYASLDAHGTYNYVGTRAVEIYNNIFLNATNDVNWAIHIRGGGGTIFNNRVRGYYQPGRTSIFLHMTNEGTVQKCWPHDLYIWNNDLEAGMTFLQLEGQEENVDYFLYEKPGYVPYPYPHPLTLEASP